MIARNEQTVKRVVGVDIVKDQGTAIIGHMEGDTLHIDQTVSGECIQTPNFLIIDDLIVDKALFIEGK